MYKIFFKVLFFHINILDKYLYNVDGMVILLSYVQYNRHNIFDTIEKYNLPITNNIKYYKSNKYATIYMLYINILRYKMNFNLSI